MTESCFHVFVVGRVQGVGYREWTRKQAVEIGLTGWVRNTEDGRVEAVVCGTDAAVATLLERMKRGPLLARVDSVDAEKKETEAFSGFDVRREP
jgi:acylphosphatase